MIIFPAIDIKDKECVRLYKGDFATAGKVADSYMETALNFKKAGAEWIHMVDLNGALDGVRINSEIFIDVAKNSGLKVEVGGGIRTMKDVEFYIQNHIQRVIIGSAALKNPQLVYEACREFGDRIAVGIDAKNEMVATEGWTEKSDTHYIDLAKRMEDFGVKYIIYTDIDCDGMLSGPNLEQLIKLNEAVSCNITASGGIKDLSNIVDLSNANMYGAICGRSIYSGTLDLKQAVDFCKIDFDKYFVKSDLIPAIIQEESTGEILMLAYMNKYSMQKTLETGYTWFWSRSRKELWNKGATSGHLQKVVSIHGDCDDDTLLVKVIQTGPACHTGNKTCFFNKIK